MIRKTQVERIVDLVVTAAGLSPEEAERLLREHRNEVDRRRQEGVEAPTEGTFTAIQAGVDPGDVRTRRTFNRLLLVCDSPRR